MAEGMAVWPRMVTSRADTERADLNARVFGISRSASSMATAAVSVMSWPVTTVSATGTSNSFSSRRRACTMISSRLESVAAVAAASMLAPAGRAPYNPNSSAAAAPPSALADVFKRMLRLLLLAAKLSNTCGLAATYRKSRARSSTSHRAWTPCSIRGAMRLVMDGSTA
jgi:hypothetical protein